MHPETRACEEVGPIPCGGAVCGLPGPGCEAARGVARLLDQMGMVGWHPRPGWSCERAEASLLFLSNLKPPGRPSLDGSTGASPQLVVRLPVTLRDRAVRTASLRGVPVAAVVRTALERYLDVVEGEPLPVPVRPPPAPTVLRVAARLRAEAGCAGDLEPFDAESAYAEADAADHADQRAAAEAARGPGPPRPIP